MCVRQQHRYAVYSHKLHQRNDPELEQKIDRLAEFHAKLRRGKNTVVARTKIRNKLCKLCVEYFYVTGDDLNGNVDDGILSDLILKAIDKYDPKKKDASLVHYIVKVYPLRVKDEGRRQENEGDNLVSLDEHAIDESHDARMADEASDFVDAGYGGNLLGGEDLLESGEPDVEGEDLAEENLYLRLLVELEAFLDHQNLNHDDRSRLYRRMVFTERITYAVKSQPNISGCQAIERHEKDTFARMELGFLDTFMANETRTVSDLYSGEMVNGYADKIRRLSQSMIKYAEGGRTKPPGIAWLPNDAYQGYLEERYGIKVTSSAISRQRKQFDAFEAKIMR